MIKLNKIKRNCVAAVILTMCPSAVADDKILHIYHPYFLLANPSPICYNSFMFTLSV